MARPRRSGDVQRFFTFGGRLPPAIGFLLALMLVASVAGWMQRGLLGLAALAPGAILGGELWRLVSWPFFQSDPFGLLFGGLMMYWIGPQLVYVWGEKRLLVRFFGYAAFASIATALLAIPFPAARAPHIGVWPVANALIVSWAMLFPTQQVNIWGVLPVTGRNLALLIVGGTVLYGLAGGGIAGIGAFAPHLFAILAAWLGSRAAARTPWTEAKQWWAEREQKRRTKHLKVVRKDGSDERPRWMN